MKCSQCKEKLAEYIEGNLSAEVDEKIAEHLLTCESCKEAYEEELMEYEAFKAAFSTEGINFESITPKVMNAIDKNKYSNGVKVRKTKYFAPVAAALFICVAISPFALNYINGGMAERSETADKGRAMQQPDSEGHGQYSLETAEEAAKSSEDNSLVGSNAGQEQGYSVNLYSMSAVTNPVIEDNTPYIATEDGVLEATIAGKGEKAQEEGIGTIYVKNNSNQQVFEMKINNTDKQVSPLSISWYDNQHLIIVQGGGYGTIANGVEIVVMNVTNAEQIVIAAVEDSSLTRYEHAYREGNDFVIETKRYTDDMMNDFVNMEIRAKDYQLGDFIK